MLPVANCLLPSERVVGGSCCPDVVSVSRVRRNGLERDRQSDRSEELRPSGPWQRDCFVSLVAHTRKETMKVQIKSACPKKYAERGEFIVKLLKHCLAFLLIVSLALATVPAGFAYQTDGSTASAPIQAAQQTLEQLQQLVAPIALYPDALVAQILAASTYATDIVEADRWMQQHPELKGQQLGEEVDKQPWDPSVKALTQFPSVLANMDKNLSWTSSLGDAYVNQQQTVMAAVQVMRQRAQQAGNLKSTPQQSVTTQGKTIVIEPANPEVVYVPAYDPWLVYGSPLAVWPGWYPVPGIFIGGPAIEFGIGFGIGYFGGFGWGWHHWGFDWHNR